MAKYGREPDHMKIMPGLRTVVAPTRAEAQAKWDELQALLDPLVGLARVYNTFGDLSGYDVDGPMPDLDFAPRVKSIADRIMARARRDRMTIRQLYNHIIAGGFLLIGTPADIVDGMQEWFEAGACDGFNILPTHLPVACEDFVALVTPELQRRGLFRTTYEGSTLRANLGLPMPVNRYAAARLAQRTAE
jgi:alkanesulfonate monooxygenase SsuD/methylene tetrahydromethanopterin reductase-like flavin-dependent oxidoreductase (luciferase family)